MGLIFTPHAILRYALRRHLALDGAEREARISYRRGRQLTRTEAEGVAEKRFWAGYGDVTWRADGMVRGVWLTARRSTGAYAVFDFQAPGDDADHIIAVLELLKATTG